MMNNPQDDQRQKNLALFFIFYFLEELLELKELNLN